MSRKVLVMCVAIAFVAVGCSRSPSGPLKYSVELDAKSSVEEKLQFSAFFPGELRVSAGDSIKFKNRSTEAPHTVTFGVLPDRSNQPPIVLETGENPVVTDKCHFEDAPTTKSVKCENKRLPAFDGEGYWNSGFLQAKPLPKSAGPKSVTLKLAKEIPPGSYTFVCILHPFMNGAMTVVDDAGDRSKPADVREGAKDAVKQAREDADEFATPELERTDDGVTATVGWGDRVTSVNRYSPESIDVKSGEKVTWVVKNPYEPHTVTFGGDFEPGDPKGFPPSGVGSGGDYTGGLANSGLIGAEDTPFEGTYSLTFTEPGTYKYSCVLHPGQLGTVKVGS